MNIEKKISLIGNPLKTKGFLFHGTKIDKVNSILKRGLLSIDFSWKKYKEKLPWNNGVEPQGYYGYDLISVYDPWFYSENAWFSKDNEEEMNLCDLIYYDRNNKYKYNICKTNRDDVVSKINKALEFRKIPFREPEFYFLNELTHDYQIFLIISNKIKTEDVPGWFVYENFVKDRVKPKDILGIIIQNQEIDNKNLRQIFIQNEIPIYKTNGELMI